MAVVTLAAAIGCGAEPSGGTEEVVEASGAVAEALAPRALAVDYAGCRDIWLQEAVRCIFDPPTPLRLWVFEHPSTEVTVRVDGVVPRTDRYGMEGMFGFGLRVRLPEGAKALEVVPENPDLKWSLAVQVKTKEAKAPEGVQTKAFVDQKLIEAYGVYSEKPFEAQKILDEIEAIAALYPEGAAAHASFQGVVHWGRERYFDAATSFRRAVSFAVRLEDPLLMQEALPLYATSLVELGFNAAAYGWGQEALTFLRAKKEDIACENRARFLSTVGYIQNQLKRQHEKTYANPIPLFEEALGLSREECPSPQVVPGLLLSLAEARLLEHDPRTALAVLAEVDEAQIPTSDQRFRLRDAKLRALLASGAERAELDDAVEGLRRSVDDAGLIEGRWRLALREGDLARRHGRLDDAIAAYREAEAESQKIVELAAIGVGRETAATLHEESTERLVSALVERGWAGEALCAAREAQARRIQAVVGGAADSDSMLLDEAIDDYRAAVRDLDAVRAEQDVQSGDVKAVLARTVKQSEQRARNSPRSRRVRCCWVSTRLPRIGSCSCRTKKERACGCSKEAPPTPSTTLLSAGSCSSRSPRESTRWRKFAWSPPGALVLWMCICSSSRGGLSWTESPWCTGPSFPGPNVGRPSLRTMPMRCSWPIPTKDCRRRGAKCWSPPLACGWPGAGASRFPRRRLRFSSG